MPPGYPPPLGCWAGAPLSQLTGSQGQRADVLYRVRTGARWVLNTLGHEWRVGLSLEYFGRKRFPWWSEALPDANGQGVSTWSKPKGYPRGLEGMPKSFHTLFWNNPSCLTEGEVSRFMKLQMDTFIPLDLGNRRCWVMSCTPVPLVSREAGMFQSLPGDSLARLCRVGRGMAAQWGGGRDDSGKPLRGMTLY